MNLQELADGTRVEVHSATAYTTGTVRVVDPEGTKVVVTAAGIALGEDWFLDGKQWLTLPMDFMSDENDVEEIIDDMVKSPGHYTDGRKYEPALVFRDWNLPFTLGSAAKYISRAGRKVDAAQDLQKAQRFVELELEHLASGGGRYLFNELSEYDVLDVIDDWDLGTYEASAIFFLARAGELLLTPQELTDTLQQVILNLSDAISILNS